MIRNLNETRFSKNDCDNNPITEKDEVANVLLNMSKNGDSNAIITCVPSVSMSSFVFHAWNVTFYRSAKWKDRMHGTFPRGSCAEIN